MEESGALLVRHDKHIAWRSMTQGPDPYAELRRTLSAVLGRSR
ncbi:aromatic-ring hydroxylase C-terminal domain-containing protein [Nocardioides marmoraquaticus]